MTYLVSKLAEMLDISSREVVKLAATAPFRYKVYTIPKRKGGSRIIAQPTPAVKDLQRATVKILSRWWQPHDAATAYVDGRGVKDNARLHARNTHLLKMDFSNFFNSLTPREFKNRLALTPIEEIEASDIDILVSTLFWSGNHRGGLCLSVGAPSSPYISNIIMKSFDAAMVERCGEGGVSYSRYADDLTFSADSFEKLSVMQKVVKNYLQRANEVRLQINAEKTVYVSKKFQRRVTGVVLTNDGSISIGRDRKRLLRAQIHRFSLGELNEIEIKAMSGMLAFAFDVEPSFVNTLRRVFGQDVIACAFKGIKFESA